MLFTNSNRNEMVQVALLAWLEAKPGMEQELADFLKSAQPLAMEEKDTVNWYAWQIDNAVFGIFDTFEAEEDVRRTLREKLLLP
jgi:hypothetical protein